MSLGYRDTLWWCIGAYVVAQSGDKCVSGSWVFVWQSQVHWHAVCSANSMGIIFTFKADHCSWPHLRAIGA